MEVEKILSTVLDIYHDEDFDRIPLETYLSYISDALNLVLLVRPDANAVGYEHTVTQGNEQTLPDDGFRLIDVVYSLDESDNPYRPVTHVDKMVLDNSHPTWMADTDTYVVNYMFDPTTPKKFYIYPQATDSKLYIYYSKAFTAITDRADTVDLDEIFFTPVVDAVLYYLYRIDSESSEFALDKAQFYANSVNNALGIEQQKGLDISPAEGK